MEDTALLGAFIPFGMRCATDVSGKRNLAAAGRYSLERQRWSGSTEEMTTTWSMSTTTGTLLESDDPDNDKDD